MTDENNKKKTSKYDQPMVSKKSRTLGEASERLFNRESYRVIQNAFSKMVSEYDQEIPQSQTADKSMAPRGGATQQSRYIRSGRQTKQSNKLSLSLPNQDDCKTRNYIK